MIYTGFTSSTPPLCLVRESPHDVKLDGLAPSGSLWVCPDGKDGRLYGKISPNSEGIERKENTSAGLLLTFWRSKPSVWYLSAVGFCCSPSLWGDSCACPGPLSVRKRHPCAGVSRCSLVDPGSPPSPSVAMWLPSLYSRNGACGWGSSKACRSLEAQRRQSVHQLFFKPPVENLFCTIVEDIAGLVLLFTALVLFMPSGPPVCYCRTHVAVRGHGAARSLRPAAWNHRAKWAQKGLVVLSSSDLCP